MMTLLNNSVLHTHTSSITNHLEGFWSQPIRTHITVSAAGAIHDDVVRVQDALTPRYGAGVVESPEVIPHPDEVQRITAAGR